MPEQEIRLGIMSISHVALQSISPAITIDACSLQRELRDQGVFARLHRFLMLPPSYTIKALFYARGGDWREWEIWIESPDFPVTETAWAGDLPEICPIYCQVKGEVHLVRVDIRPQPRSLPVSGGIDWLMKALLGERKAEDYGKTS